MSADGGDERVKEAEETASGGVSVKRKRTDSETAASPLSAACGSSSLSAARTVRGFSGVAADVHRAERTHVDGGGTRQDGSRARTLAQPDFKLEETPPAEGSLERRVHDAMHRAFWDKLRVELDATPPVYEGAFGLLAEIKENLLQLLLPQHTQLRASIEEQLDLQLLRQECAHGCLQFDKVANYLTSVMERLCAPVRDEQLKRVKECDDIVDTFRGILELLELMKTDMANFTLSSFRPTIERHSAEYERDKFEQFLKISPDGLHHTELWLGKAYDKWSDSNKQSAQKHPKMSDALPDADSTALDRSSLDAILTIAYWDLLSWELDAPYPETIAMDAARLRELGSECVQLVAVASAASVAWQAAGRDVAELAAFRERLRDRLLVILADCRAHELGERLRAVADDVAKEVNEQRVALSQPPLGDDAAQSLRERIGALADADSPVRKLMEERCRLFATSVISTPNASPIKVPPGLGVVQAPLARLTSTFLRVVTHNKATFVDLYERLLTTRHKRTCSDAVSNAAASSPLG